MGNILIKNGMIIDGTGCNAFKADVQVVGDRIKSVIPAGASAGEENAAGGVEQIIDAAGLVVAPGFIDCHSHLWCFSANTWQVCQGQKYPEPE